MAMYLFASRISAAVCARTTPSSPTHTPWPGPSPRPVCLLQPKKSKSQKKVVLAVTATELGPGTRAPCSDGAQPPPYREKDADALVYEDLHLVSGGLDALVYEDLHLVSGSLDALVALLTPTTASYPDRGFLFAFLLSSRLFLRPHELLAQVLAACHSQQTSCDKPSTAKERLERVMPPMVKLLSEWTDMFPYDFRDDRMTAEVRGITQGCDCVPQVCDDVSAVLHTLVERLSSLERFEDQLAALEPEATASHFSQLSSTDAAEVCGTAGRLAQQLTGIELERMSYVGPEEFVQAWMREAVHPLHQGRTTSNLESYVAWSTRLSMLVATDICKQAGKKHRVRLTEFWIEAAKECFNIGNFNSLAAILAGLNMAPVSRLTTTWNKAGGERLRVLRQAMDPGEDHANYRASLKAAAWRASACTAQNIVIPIFPLLVQDVYSRTEHCSKLLPNGHVNVEGMWRLAKGLTDFMSWQQTACPFPRCARATSYLQGSPVLCDQALMLASFDCETPETTLEKEHYVKLKLVPGGDLN